MGNPSKDGPWEAIFSMYGIHGHDFDKAPFPLSAQQIKDATKDFPKTGQREVRILCYQAERKDRPQVFSDNGLFLLPVRNGHYVIVRGEGYIDISDITSPPVEFTPKANFELQTPLVGDSEMQHLDYAHASGMLEDFVGIFNSSPCWRSESGFTMLRCDLSAVSPLEAQSRATAVGSW